MEKLEIFACIAAAGSVATAISSNFFATTFMLIISACLGVTAAVAEFVVWKQRS